MKRSIFWNITFDGVHSVISQKIELFHNFKISPLVTFSISDPKSVISADFLQFNVQIHYSHWIPQVWLLLYTKDVFDSSE
jgi:hypothetical protein